MDQQEKRISNNVSITTASGFEPKGGGTGRILRVKRGYNPNSSSMGSEIIAFYAMPAVMLIVPVIFGTAAAVIAAAFGQRHSGEDRTLDQESAQTGANLMERFKR